MDIPVKVVVHRAKEGGYWAEVPGTGCVTEAETLEQLRQNVHESFRGWFAVVQEDDPRAEPDPDDAGPVVVLTL